jgi:hypothetical protein
MRRVIGTVGIWVGVLIFSSTPPADAQSLRGSRSSVDRMYTRAVSNDLDFFRTSTSLMEAVKSGELKLIAVTSDLDLDEVTYPYLLPSTLAWTNALAKRHRAACGERLIVTSATRPRREQPRNASPKSVHPTGMAVDFRRPTGQCLTWLRSELLAMERAGTIEATEERRPPHFHIAVLRQTADPPRAIVAETRTAPAATGNDARANDGTAAARPTSYVVRKGDTLSEIAQRFGTTTRRLQSLNSLNGTRIRIGQKLVIG